MTGRIVATPMAAGRMVARLKAPGRMVATPMAAGRGRVAAR
jgi:hypothetical protein